MQWDHIVFWLTVNLFPPTRWTPQLKVQEHTCSFSWARWFGQTFWAQTQNVTSISISILQHKNTCRMKIDQLWIYISSIQQHNSIQGSVFPPRLLKLVIALVVFDLFLACELSKWNNIYLWPLHRCGTCVGVLVLELAFQTIGRRVEYSVLVSTNSWGKCHYTLLHCLFGTGQAAYSLGP